jgi:hypothetical protein
MYHDMGQGILSTGLFPSVVEISGIADGLPRLTF